MQLEAGGAIGVHFDIDRRTIVGDLHERRPASRSDAKRVEQSIQVEDVLAAVVIEVVEDIRAVELRRVVYGVAAVSDVDRVVTHATGVDVTTFAAVEDVAAIAAVDRV